MMNLYDAHWLIWKAFCSEKDPIQREMLRKLMFFVKETIAHLKLDRYDRLIQRGVTTT